MRGRAAGLRHMAGAAEHASETPPTLSERRCLAGVEGQRASLAATDASLRRRRAQLERESGARCARVETLRVSGFAASGTGVTTAPGGGR